MADDRQVKELFLAARDVAAADRPSWLTEACGDDASLRREVESLLAAEEGMPAGYLTSGSRTGLTPGSKVSGYRILELLGAGGMGEVWLAHDERLDRRVALKLAVPAVLGDPSIHRRVQREARSAALLEHPAACRVFELGEVDGRDLIVMEYLEGETLAVRLSCRPVPLPQALAWGAAIAGALQEAHDKGLVHRDLKPGNVMVTPAGAVKVMDFGLARPSPPGHGPDPAPGTADLTEPGMILGTPAYMAPEQLEGEPADERSDVWAFGCLLYEMLTGRRAFPGDSTVHTLAAILDREPDWRQLPAATPWEVRSLLARSLRKDPERRLRHLGDFRLALEDAAAGEPVPGPSVERAAPPPRPWRRLAFAAAVAVSGVLLGALAAMTWLAPPAPDPEEPVRMTAALPHGVEVTTGPGFAGSVALSPDGRTLVVAGVGEDGHWLYRRRLDRLETVLVAGTQGGTSPFFSPDGRWIGFFADKRLWRVPVDGGAAVEIAAAPGFPRGASWGPDDRVVFAYGARSSLHTVDARGGAVERLTEHGVEDSESYQSSPQFSPDGRTLLFESDGWVHALDVASGRHTALVRGVSPRWVDGDLVVLSRSPAILAVPFDPSRLEVTGPAVPLPDIVGLHAHKAHYAISREGTLAYLPTAVEHALVLVDEGGAERPLTETRYAFENPQFSPDGLRLAVARSARPGEASDVWVYEIETGAPSRLTSDGGRAPVWTPDGASVTYSHLGRRRGIYTRSVDGWQGAERLLALDEFHWLVGWTPDGRTLVYGMLEGARDDGTSPSSIFAFTAGQSRRVVGPGDVWGGRLSPDGRWLAYYSLESGRFEVYVTPFPAADTRWVVSEDGGRDPSWAPDGNELYYRSGNRLTAARLDTEGKRVLSRRTVLEPFSPPLYDDYDVHPDGRTVAMVRPAGTRGHELVMVRHWLAELRRLVLR